MENIILFCDGLQVSDRDFKLRYDYTDDEFKKKIYNSKKLGYFEMDSYDTKPFKFLLYDKETKAFISEKTRGYGKATQTVKEDRTFKRGQHKRVIYMDGIERSLKYISQYLSLSPKSMQVMMRKYKAFRYRNYNFVIKRECTIFVQKKNGKILKGLTIQEIAKMIKCTENNAYTLMRNGTQSREGWRIWNTGDENENIA